MKALRALVAGCAVILGCKGALPPAVETVVEDGEAMACVLGVGEVAQLTADSDPQLLQALATACKAALADVTKWLTAKEKADNFVKGYRSNHGPKACRPDECDL